MPRENASAATLARRSNTGQLQQRKGFGCFPFLARSTSAPSTVALKRGDTKRTERIDDLPSAVQAFRQTCTVSLQALGCYEEMEPLMDAACGLVEGLLLGINQHLPNVQTHTELRTRTATDGMDTDLVRFSIRFEEAPLEGEIATRSRVAVSVRIDECLCFGLQQPKLNGSDPRGEGPPLVLSVSGFNMPNLEDCRRVREQIKQDLPGDKFKPDSAYDWWVQNKDKFPPQSSKFHRVVESLLEQRAFKLLGRKIAVESFWGYLHTCDLNPDVFVFQRDKRIKPRGVALTVRLKPAADEQEQQLRDRVQEITKGKLKSDRRAADKLAPSAISVGAMICGPDIGQEGAKPEVVTKLLSAASWWGCGEVNDSWHSLDLTWKCTDRKDYMQRVVESQGRLIWRVAGSVESPMSRHPTKPKPLGRKSQKNVLLDPLVVARLAALFLMLMTFAPMVQSAFKLMSSDV